MEFQKVNHFLLKADKKYKIVWKDKIYTDIFYDYSMNGMNISANFLNVKYNSFLILPDIGVCFYQPIFRKKQIQQTMETRALHLIIQGILGDPYFYWYHEKLKK
jgi:hypothetical protein